MIEDWWPVALLIVLILVTFSISSRPDPAMRLREKREANLDKKRLLRDGYVLEDGVTKCSSCRSYCGQCSNASAHGLTMAEYRAKYWQRRAAIEHVRGNHD